MIANVTVPGRPYFLALGVKPGELAVLGHDIASAPKPELCVRDASSILALSVSLPRTRIRTSVFSGVWYGVYVVSTGLEGPRYITRACVC